MKDKQFGDLVEVTDQGEWIYIKFLPVRLRDAKKVHAQLTKAIAYVEREKKKAGRGT